LYKERQCNLPIGFTRCSYLSLKGRLTSSQSFIHIYDYTLMNP